MTGAQSVVKALEDEGIAFAFGIPGTHNIELYDSLSDSDKVRPILVTDEQSASFMADAVWRASGNLACVNLVPGAGLTHALSGIAEAFLDNIPLLVLTCGIRNDFHMSYQLHDVDQMILTQAIVKDSFCPSSAEKIYPCIRMACQLARQGAPGPVMVEIPANYYLFKSQADLNFNQKEHQKNTADVEKVKKIANLLNQAKKPLLYIGLGAKPACEQNQLQNLAENLQALVATTIQGKGVFPENHPLFIWPGLGRALPPALKNIVEQADVMLALGCRFGELATASYGFTPPETLIHVDIDEKVLNRNYKSQISMQADSNDFIQKLLPLIQKRPENLVLHQDIQKALNRVTKKWKNLSSECVSPYKLLSELQKHMGEDTIFTADSGNGLFLAMEILRLGSPQKFLAPVDYSCMGYSIPAAIGAQLAQPQCAVVSLTGDGAFLMTGLELLTAQNLNLPILVIILRDKELAQISQFQKVILNRPTCSELPSYDLEKIAQGLHIPCLKCEKENEVFPVIREAKNIMQQNSPVVVDCHIDYSQKTYFTKGVVKTNFARLPLKERCRFVARTLKRKIIS